MKSGQKKFWVSNMLKRVGCRLDTPKCEKKDWPKVNNKKVMPPCCVNHLRDVLFYLHDLFEEQNIHYWMDFGTLLGAIRTGTHIPHDTDGDFGVFYTDRKKIIGLRSRIESDGFGMFVHQSKNYQEERIHGQTVIRIPRSPINHMTVDLFFWKRNELTGQLTSDGLNVHKSFPDIFVQGRKEVEIFGRKLWGPNNPEEFLRFRYGSDWHIEQKKKVNFKEANATHNGIFAYGDTQSTKLKLV